MARNRKANVTAETANEIAARATWFLNQTDGGAHGDKRVASRFSISLSMAKLLRRGQGWTLARIEQARRSYGPSFDHMVFGPITGGGHALESEIAQLQSAVNRLATAWRRGPLDIGDPDLAFGRVADPYRVAPVEDSERRDQGEHTPQLRSGNSRRHPAMDAPIVRKAAE